MGTKEDVQAKLQALLDASKEVMATAENVHGGRFVKGALSRRWGTSVLVLFRSVFGENSPLYTQASKILARNFEHMDEVEQLWGVVASGVDYWREGYVFDLRREAEAEVEGSILSAAARELATKTGMNEPERRAAAVLAGSVLERHLRQVGVALGITDAEKLHIEALSVELKKLGVFDELMRKAIVGHGAMRNAAAHDVVFSGTKEDVERMIFAVTDICSRVR
jgi:hypothetical protein